MKANVIGYGATIIPRALKNLSTLAPQSKGFKLAVCKRGLSQDSLSVRITAPLDAHRSGPPFFLVGALSEMTEPIPAILPRKRSCGSYDSMTHHEASRGAFCDTGPRGTSFGLPRFVPRRRSLPSRGA
jgi:hypothetical protein